MKCCSRSVITLCIVILLGTAVAAQTDKRVRDIRDKVSDISRSAGKFSKTKKDVPDISTEGAEATFYHSGKDLKKVSVKIYGETFNGTSELYFDGGQLIFAYDRINRYDTQIGLKKPVKVVRVEEYRSYFENGGMFRLLIGKKVLTPASEEFAEHEKEILERTKAILASENE